MAIAKEIGWVLKDCLSYWLLGLRNVKAIRNFWICEKENIKYVPIYNMEKSHFSPTHQSSYQCTGFHPRRISPPQKFFSFFVKPPNKNAILAFLQIFILLTLATLKLDQVNRIK